MVKKSNKTKKFSIQLSEKEVGLLTRYAKSNHCSRPAALKRIVKLELRNLAQSYAGESVSPNQLSLFHVSNQTNLLDAIPSEQ